MEGYEVETSPLVGDENKAVGDDVPLIHYHQRKQRHEGVGQIVEVN